MYVSYLCFILKKTIFFIRSSSIAFSSVLALWPTINLEVKLDNALTFDSNVNWLAKDFLFFLNLCWLSLLFHSRHDFKPPSQKQNKNSFLRLQLVQNALAQLITSERWYQPITPVLASLHWLPIQFGVNFKFFLLVF